VIVTSFVIIVVGFLVKFDRSSYFKYANLRVIV
jgi:hypothetical protein